MFELNETDLEKAAGGNCWPPDPTDEVCMFFTLLTILDTYASGSGGEQYIANVDIMGNPTGL